MVALALGTASVARAEPGTAAESPTLAAATTPPCDDCFADATGAWQDASSTYDTLNDRGEPHRVHVLLGIAAILGIGSGWYWLDDRNIADWDKPALKQRFTGEAWRMDNNGFAMNFADHPWTGGAYYGVARAGHLSAGESALGSFLGSMFWEFVLEFNEKISINDVLATPGGGITLGEFAHKLSWYLNTAPTPSAGRQAVAWTLGPGASLSRALYGAPPSSHMTRDPLGYASEIWHDFRFSYSVSALDDGRSDPPVLHAYQAHGTLVSIPGYLRPGRLKRFFSEADLTSLTMEIEQSTRGVGFRFQSDTTLLGWLTQDFGYGSQPRGLATVVGAHIGYRYASSRAVFDELFAALHFPSLGLELHARTPGVSADLGLRAQLDFAGMRPPAYASWKAAHPDAREKTILIKQQYDYAWGGSTEASAAVSFGPLRFATELFLGSYDSIEGLDRSQHAVTDDVDAKDTLLESTARLEIHVAPSPTTFGGFATRRVWHSRVGKIGHDVDVATVGARLTAEF